MQDAREEDKKVNSRPGRRIKGIRCSAIERRQLCGSTTSQTQSDRHKCEVDMPKTGRSEVVTETKTDTRVSDMIDGLEIKRSRQEFRRAVLRNSVHCNVNLQSFHFF